MEGLSQRLECNEMQQDSDLTLQRENLAFLAGGREMGERIREYDWTRTTLGSIHQWPQSLRSALSICLNSLFPTALYWGEDLCLLYNDEWSSIPGKKHPWALGQTAQDTWPEIWDILQPMFQRVMTRGETIRNCDALLPMHRHGFTEECYFDYTLSPIRGESGRVEGVFNAVLETTGRVIGERRLRTLRELSNNPSIQGHTASETCATIASILAKNDQDISFSMLYLHDATGQRAILAGATGIQQGCDACPTVIDLNAARCTWSLRSVLQTGNAVEVRDVVQRYGDLPGGCWPESTQTAMVLPLTRPGQSRIPGFLIVGLSPRLPIDAEYLGFIDLLRDYVAHSVSQTEIDQAREAARAQMEFVRRRASESLRESEQRLRMALSAARMVAWQYEPFTGRFVVSENAVEVFGLPTDAHMTVHEQRLELIHPDDIDRYREQIRRVMAEHGSYVIQYRMIRVSDHQEIWLEERGNVVGDDPELIQLLGVVMDITSRKQSEQAMLNARTQLESTLAASEIGTWDFDLLRNEVRVDPNFRQMLQLESSSDDDILTLEQCLSVVHSDDHDRVQRAIEMAVQQSDNLMVECRLVRHDDIRWVVARGRVVRDESGRAVRLPGVAVDITGQRMAEEREKRILAQSVADNAKFQAFFEQGGVFAGILDVEGTLLDVNRLSCEGCGFQRHDIVGKLYWDGPWWTSSDFAVEQIRIGVAQAASGNTFRAELPYVTSDGTERFLDTLILPIQDELGRVTFLAQTGSDVTDRRRAEEGLRQRAEEIRTLLDTLPIGIFIAHDSECRHITGNRSAQSLLRSPNRNLSKSAPEDERPMHFRVCRNGVEIPYDQLPVQRAARGEHVRNEEVDDIFEDGTILHTIISAAPLYNTNGMVRGAVACVLDVTEQKKAQQAVRESQRILRGSLDALRSHIAVLDETGRILELNAAWKRFADENNFVGDNYGLGSDYLEMSERSEDTCGEGKIIAQGIRDVISGKLDRYQTVYPCHSPVEQRWFVMEATRFPGPGPLRVVIAHDNVTERKLAEETLREADRRKNEFLATLAHELRSPLAPIRNGLQLMQMADSQDPLIRNSCVMIERQVAQMVRLVDDLMDISRISQGKLRLQKKVIPLLTAVQSAIETSKPIIEEMGHRLSIALPDASVEIDGDLTRLAQVFTNLLSNAAKYTDRCGQIDLIAAIDGTDAIITVRDNGIGIAPDQLPQLFKMFSQLGNVSDKTQGGLGIGLSLVKQIVELHSGTITANSAGLNHGSEFVVRLPVFVENSETVMPNDQGVEILKKSSLRILVVDDNKDGADSLGMMLRLMGHETRTAYDGEAGVEAAHEFRPDVILLDIGLPRLNGYDACRRIREQRWGQTMILVAVTGWGQDDDRRKSRDAGFNHHLVKPVESRALMEIFSQVTRSAAEVSDAVAFE
jgi:PAS domain S-box-containing protein